jgi:hypothetical protein
MEQHKTVPVLVWVDVDEGIAEVVKYLNTIPGVRTCASCQGTLGDGGPEPYGPQVMISWNSKDVQDRLRHEFVVDMVSECLAYVRPMDGKWDVLPTAPGAFGAVRS